MSNQDDFENAYIRATNALKKLEENLRRDARRQAVIFFTVLTVACVAVAVVVWFAARDAG